MDNQTVVLKYKNNGPLVNFHVTATTKAMCQRSTEIYGSHGQIISHSPTRVEFTDFTTNQTKIFDQSDEEYKHEFQVTLQGHGGADGLFLNDMLECLEAGKQLLTRPKVTLSSHKLAFLAEESRKSKKSCHYKFVIN